MCNTDSDCMTGLHCDTQSNTCVVDFCGDGIAQAGLGEECDDGNTADGDGCSSGCLNEAICGNGIVEFGEQCNDGEDNCADCDCTTDCRFQL